MTFEGALGGGILERQDLAEATETKKCHPDMWRAQSFAAGGQLPLPCRSYHSQPSNTWGCRHYGKLCRTKFSPPPDASAVITRRCPAKPPIDYGPTNKHNPIPLHVPHTSNTAVPHGSPFESIVCARENLVKVSGLAGG